ncbi:MAG: HAMP domain-containing histidine kinase [Candidatus Buchananbacteria bacterium]|nr:HAMP domain-containing histidine kinase [Candidatus Buchananbacteria bacterium]
MTENQNQNQKISQDVKGDFITIASHQLRTPIAGIRWSLDTLLNNRAGKITDKQRDIILGAYQNNRFLARAVSDLLRASRVEDEHFVLAPEKVDLVKMINEVVRHTRDFARAYNCEISLKIEDNLPLVYFDPLQLKPIFEGLVDNAVRYSQVEGQAGEVEISLKRIDGNVVFSVSDRGVGIPKDEQALIFTRFFRARNAMKAQTEGLGLDLYIAKKVIEKSGGKINFTSLENKGTTFFVYLPIEPVKEEIKPTDKAKNVEKTLQKEREFVSITVHELKAPLGMAKWSLEMLKNGKVGKLNNDQTELVNQVYRGNERLLVLVRDLLDLAKLQEGKFDVEPKPFDLKTVVDDAITAFRAQAEKKKIIIDLPSLKGSWPGVSGDQNRVSQVVTNLISNAIKYTPEGGHVVVEVKQMSGDELKVIGQEISTANINNTDNKNGYLVISVKDTGIGISEEDQKKLFTRFFRSKNVMQSKAEGTGLGLYITKTIVELHKGDIWFTSAVGKGSTFYFSLPII